MKTKHIRTSHQHDGGRFHTSQNDSRSFSNLTGPFRRDKVPTVFPVAWLALLVN